MSRDAPKIGLPVRPFLYTIDQICVVLSLTDQQVKSYIFYDGRSTGHIPRTKMLARNIAGPNDIPEWRIAERELVRWLKFKGFKFYDSSVVTR